MAITIYAIYVGKAFIAMGPFLVVAAMGFVILRQVADLRKQD